MESARLSWGDTCILLQKGCKQAASFHCTSFFPPFLPLFPLPHLWRLQKGGLL